MHPSPCSNWDLYDRMIDGIDSRLTVQDVMIFQHFCLVKAGDNVGLNMTPKGPGSVFSYQADKIGRPLKEVAALCKSWNPCEAALGMAAVNAYYNRPEVPCRGTRDTGALLPNLFEYWIRRLGPKKVAMVGKAPFMDTFRELCDLTILEIQPVPGVLPAHAYSYVLEEQDLVFISGSAVANKTIPELLKFCRTPFCVVYGPSTPKFDGLFDYNVNALATAETKDERLLITHLLRGGTPIQFAEAMTDATFVA